MSYRLSTLEFRPRQVDGWTTAPLRFGRSLTLVYGPNGSGKTPVIKGVPFALGHAVGMPLDIRTHCAAVVLQLADGGKRISIERHFSENFVVHTSDAAGHSDRFDDERRFSAWLFQQLGIEERQFAGKRPGVVPPYVSVLAPVFWVDQDLAWRDVYTPLSTHHFIKDQDTEVLRWILAVPAQHRAVSNDLFLAAKHTLESLNEQIAIKRNTVAALLKEVDLETDRHSLVSRRNRLLEDLRAKTSLFESYARSSVLLDERVTEALQNRESAKYSLAAAERRMERLRRASDDLTAEVSILEMNETAADAFRSLCGSESCQFFRRPEESYGRRLLYLKDQLKDFESSHSHLATEIEALRIRVAEAENEWRRLSEEKQQSAVAAGLEQVAPAVDAITTEISELTLRIERQMLAATEQDRLNRLVDMASKAEEEVAELRPTGGGSLRQTRLMDVRTVLERSFLSWLQTLQTPNVIGLAKIGMDLRPNFAGETFTENSAIGGSTRTRIVLAYHAALIETSLQLGGQHPEFLILDTPKQHELHADHLGAFVRRFKTALGTTKKPVQLLVAATEEDFVDETLADEVWRPTYQTADGPRYFAPAATDE